jgi:hypothetical protein
MRWPARHPPALQTNLRRLVPSHLHLEHCRGHTLALLVDAAHPCALTSTFCSLPSGPHAYMIIAVAGFEPAHSFTSCRGHAAYCQ